MNSELELGFKNTRRNRQNLSSVLCVALAPLLTHFLPARAQQHGRHISQVSWERAGHTRPTLLSL